MKRGKEVRWKNQEDNNKASYSMLPPKRAHQAYVEDASESQQHSQLNTPVGAITSMQTSAPTFSARAPMRPPISSDDESSTTCYKYVPGQYPSSLPRAPSPPSLSRTPTPPPPSVNVFDFLDYSQSRTPSRTNLVETMVEPTPSQGRSRPTMNPYGVPYQTPAPRTREEFARSEMMSQDNSQKKRKRHTIDVSAANSPPRSDDEMPDVYDVMSHTGLTGGLNGLTTKAGRKHSSAVQSSRKRDESPGSPMKKHRTSKDLESKKTKHAEKHKVPKFGVVKIKTHRESRPAVVATDRKSSDSSQDYDRPHKKHNISSHHHDDMAANGEAAHHHHRTHSHRERGQDHDRPESRERYTIRKQSVERAKERRPSRSPEPKRRDTKQIECYDGRSATAGSRVTHIATISTPPMPTSTDVSSSSKVRPRGGSQERAVATTSQELATYIPPDRLASMFMSLVNKGPDSSRGCSINKVLKRFHRQRFGDGGEAGEDIMVRVSKERRDIEEDSLWRAVRLRRNDAGEIVLFF